MTVILLNAGLPMIFPALPVMVVALLPVILLEAFLLRNSLEITFWNSLKSSGIANIVSTFIGIPLTWLLLVVLQLVTGGGYAYGINTPFKKFLAVTWQSPWLIPYKRNTRWMVFAAGLVLLIPFFFVSWFSENWIVAYILGDAAVSDTNQAVRNANLLSYGLLALYLLAMLIKTNFVLSKAMSNKLLDVRRKQRLS